MGYKAIYGAPAKLLYDALGQEGTYQGGYTAEIRTEDDHTRIDAHADNSFRIFTASKDGTLSRSIIENGVKTLTTLNPDKSIEITQQAWSPTVGLNGPITSVPVNDPAGLTAELRDMHSSVGSALALLESMRDAGKGATIPDQSISAVPRNNSAEIGRT